LAIKEEFPQVVIIENKFNAGFSGANNQGIQKATGEYLFLLNPDTEIYQNTLEKLLNYILENNNCVIVAPQLLNTDLSIQASVFKNHSVIDLVVETLFLHKVIDTINYSKPLLNTTFNVKAISGAALFFHRNLMEKIGLIDEKLFWMEDVDICYRALKYGDLIYYHEAKVIHHIGQSSKKNYKITISNQLLSKLKYYRKHSSIINSIIANVFCLIFIISRLIVFSLLSPVKKLWRIKALAYFYTLKKYFRYVFVNDMSIT
jgi:N-acetylglucosaminyl-diphospho-decaprenol L-rhamnosyltransferase